MQVSDPRRFTRAALLYVCLGTAWLDHIGFSATARAYPGYFEGSLLGKAPAPAQYRIAPLHLANLLYRLAHIPLRDGLAVVDAVCILVTAFVLHGLLQQSSVYRSVGNSARWAGSLGLVAGFAWYLTWLTYYQRPETMPSAAIVVCLLWLWTPSPRQAVSPERSRGKPALLSLGIVALTALQGATRADIGLTLHIGIFGAAAFTALGRHLSLPRSLSLAVSAIAVGVAGACQFYISHVMYPNARYPPGTPFFMLPANLSSPSRWLPFLTFMAPSLWLALQIRRKDRNSDVGWGFFVGAVLFLAFWFVAGSIEEVRIFLPFAVALLPLTLTFVMLRSQETI